MGGGAGDAAGEAAARERGLAIALWLVPGIGIRSIEAARARFGSLEAALQAPREELAAAVPARREAVARLPRDVPGALAAAAREERLAASRGARLLVRGELAYPPGLLALAGPPEVLFARGPLPPVPRLAIVGARRADAAGLALARAIAGAAVEAGLAVVSGGAIGIDAAAHAGALGAGGATQVVLGSGVLRPGPPRNRRLFARALEAGGALLSELPCVAPASVETFPRRNRLIAALARAVVVVRAGGSSGSRTTAYAARTLGRPVFAVPGGGEGCAELLAAGARPVATPDDVLAGLALPRPAARGPPLPAEHAALVAVLGPSPLGLAALAAAAGLDEAQAARALAALCRNGLAAPASGGFRRAGVPNRDG